MTDNLLSTIRDMYFERFEELELEYQLHFASRLYSWNADDAARQKLSGLRDKVMPPTHEARLDNLLNIRDELAAKDYERDVNNYERRKPFFDRYPELLLIHNALFRIRHWHCIYGVDERDLLFKILPKESIETLLANLQADDQALRELSTYAVNTLYLYDKLYTSSSAVFDVGVFASIGKTYDTGDKNDIQLLIYLYTHCILGETLFYFQPVNRLKDTYKDMLQQLEHLIDENFELINLDNKFEFLVCARICGYGTELAGRIYTEAKESLHEEGFIVDRLNQNINPQKQTFLMSEHRNVLFIMSNSDPQYCKIPIA